MGRARQAITVHIDPQGAFSLWTNLRRWPSFVDGFGHAEEVDPAWPGEGSKLVWSSGPKGRGRVTERVLESAPPHLLSTQVYEDRLRGRQTASFEPAEDGATLVQLDLEYELTQKGPFQAITDLLFIRRALRDSLARTLRRFAAEAADEAGL